MGSMFCFLQLLPFEVGKLLLWLWLLLLFSWVFYLYVYLTYCQVYDLFVATSGRVFLRLEYNDSLEKGECQTGSSICV